VVKCSEWNEADPEKQKELLTCSGTCPKQLPCGHRCPLTCHSGVCDAVCRRNVTIRCSCKRLKKEARCYDAKNTQVNCDSECKRLLKEKRAREIEEEQKKEEEQRRRKEVHACAHTLSGYFRWVKFLSLLKKLC
jgi:NF-X1-type zinc finger protein NFXL1